MGNAQKQKQVLDRGKRNWVCFYGQFQLISDLFCVYNSSVIYSEGLRIIPSIFIIMLILKKLWVNLPSTLLRNCLKNENILMIQLGQTPQKITCQYLFIRAFEGFFQYIVYLVTLLFMIFYQEERVTFFIQLFTSVFYSIGFTKQESYYKNKDNIQILWQIIELSINSFLIVSSLLIFITISIPLAITFILALIIEKSISQSYYYSDIDGEIILQQLLGYLDLPLRHFSKKRIHFYQPSRYFYVQIISHIQVMVCVFIDYYYGNQMELKLFRTLLCIFLVLALPTFVFTFRKYYDVVFPPKYVVTKVSGPQIMQLNENEILNRYMPLNGKEASINFVLEGCSLDQIKIFFVQSIMDQYRLYSIFIDRVGLIRLSTLQNYIEYNINIHNLEFFIFILELLSIYTSSLSDSKIRIRIIEADITNQEIQLYFQLNQKLLLIDVECRYNQFYINSSSLTEEYSQIITHLYLFDKFIASSLSNNPSEIAYDLFSEL